MVCETARLIIRDFTPDVKDALYGILGDAQVMKNCEPPYSPQKTAAFLSEFCIGKRGALAAVQKESGRLIGYLLFNPVEAGVYELGWFFDRHFWRQGYAYEASRALIDHAFRTLGAHKIFAETIDTVKAVGLMEKLGMKPEGPPQAAKDPTGRPADLYLYSLYKDDPRSAS